MSSTRFLGSPAEDDRVIPSSSSPDVAPVARLHLDQPLPSARQLAWLFVKDPSPLDEQEQQVVAFLQQEPMRQKAYQLSQQILSLRKKQQGEQVEGWIGTCWLSHINWWLSIRPPCVNEASAVPSIELASE